MDGVSITDLYHIKSLSQPWAAGSLTFFVENGLSQENNDYTANIYSVDQHQHIKQYTNYSRWLSMTTFIFVSRMKISISN